MLRMRPPGIALLTLTLALSALPLTVTQAATNPDARRIIFVRDGDIFSVQASGLGQRRLTFTQNNSDPSWSPGGAKIAFTSSRDGDTEIFTMNPDGTGVRKLTRNSVSDVGPRWSPNGGRIVFLRTHTFPPIGPFNETSGLTPWLMRPDGSSQRKIGLRLDDGRPFPSISDLKWSPGGTLLAGLGLDEGGPGAYGFVFDLNGDLVAGPFGGINQSFNAPNLGWANDGELLGCVDGWLRKWSVSEPYTSGEQLALTPENDIYNLPCDNPSMSGGGRFVVYTGDGVLRGIGYPASIGTGRWALALASNGPGVYDWSPSGRLLVVTTTDGLRVVAPDNSYSKLLQVNGSDPNW